jgi:hypothetical protein
MLGVIAPDDDALMMQPTAFVTNGLSKGHKRATSTFQCQVYKKSLKTVAMIFLTVALLRGSSVAQLSALSSLNSSLFSGVSRLAHILSPVKRLAHILSPVKRLAHILSSVKRLAHILSPVKRLAQILSPVKRLAHILSPVKRLAHILSPVKRTA